jgi:hypothetical protein
VTDKNCPPIYTHQTRQVKEEMVFDLVGLILASCGELPPLPIQILDKSADLRAARVCRDPLRRTLTAHSAGR